MPRAPMVLIQCHVTEPQQRKLDEYVEESGLPKAEVIRKAITYFLESERRKSERALVPTDMLRKLESVQSRTGMTPSEHIRRALASYISRSQL